MKKNGKSNIASLLLLLVIMLDNNNNYNNNKYNIARAKKTTQTAEVKIGVVVDYERWNGKMGLRCVEMALSEFYESKRGSHFKTRLAIHSRDSKLDVVGAASAGLDLIKNIQVQAIIGPVASTQAVFVVDLGEKAQVPIVSYSATSSSLNIRSSYFFQATQNQTFQVKAIGSIVQAFGWRQVAAIYVDNDYGEGLIPHLSDALQELGARLSHRTAISDRASDDRIAGELYRLMTMQTRVFVVHAEISLGPRIFAKAKEIGMMGKGYVWIATNVVANYYLSSPAKGSSVVDSMQGVIGIKTYVPETTKLRGFRARWQNKHTNRERNPEADNDDSELNVYGLWAYDAATALAVAVEETWNSKNESFGFDKTSSDGRNSTDLDTFGVSRNGPSLRKALLGVRFEGLAGNFSLVDGHLQSSTFEIVNVDGKMGRRVGFWTPESGLVQSLETSNDTETGFVNKLGRIVWPGQSYSVPKGWEIPTNRKKLRIGVPKKYSFTEFLEIKHDLVTNNTIVTGYCIDVFEAVVRELPYSIDYEFIPFTKPNTKISATYDELVYQVFLQKFDAVIGDTTIRSNRSKYVDFTLPYTESGVSMIVPVTDKQSKNSAWIFLKPLTCGLWVTSICFFIFMAVVVWILEHRINEDFRGPLMHEVGTSLWFSFSTMVFAHKERVISNLARIVMIVWVFAILILQQSYTASLTSSLTVQKLKPKINDVKELLKNQGNVGYIDGSFVHGILKDLGFSEDQLKIYKSPEECDDLFSKEKAKGGIAAAFDEFPYMKLLLAKYCSKYTMVEPTFKTGGFGFVFPKGSPLVADVSRAILKVTEDKTMKNIENKWFGQQTRCPDPNTQVSSNSLGLECFWGLFLIVGVTSMFALIAYFSIFLYEQRHILLHSNTTDRGQGLPIRTRIRLALRIFGQRDLSSHTFKKSNRTMPDTNTVESVRDDHLDCFDHRDVVESLPNTDSRPSASSFSTQTVTKDSASSLPVDNAVVDLGDEHGQEIPPRIP